MIMVISPCSLHKFPTNSMIISTEIRIQINNFNKHVGTSFDFDVSCIISIWDDSHKIQDHINE